MIAGYGMYTCLNLVFIMVFYWVMLEKLSERILLSIYIVLKKMAKFSTNLDR